jgi:alpha-L-fucosidase 2
MYYLRPALDTESAIPVGNGRIGGLVFGNPYDETIVMNSDSVWSGSFRDRNNHKAVDNLQFLRDLIRKGKTEEAERVAADCFFSSAGNPRHQMPLCDLKITMSKFSDDGEIDNYSFELDMEEATTVTRFSAGGVNFTRRVFASFVDNVMVVEFESDSPIDEISVEMVSRSEFFDKNIGLPTGNTLLLTGSTGIPFACATAAKAYTGGIITYNNRLKIQNTKKAFIAFSCQTAFYSADFTNEAIGFAQAAVRRTDLFTRHFKDYNALYSRCRLILHDNCPDSHRPIDERLKRFKETRKDNGLIVVFWNFSRYLLISGSRPGGLPLTSGGLWKTDSYDSRYNLDLPLQMSYWGAQAQNLAETAEPLCTFLRRLRTHGRETARTMYGARGFTAHSSSDIWGATEYRVQSTEYRTEVRGQKSEVRESPVSGAWLALSVWTQFLYNCDIKFLLDNYDILKEAAEFFCDFLTENENGEYTTCPTVSPGSSYIVAGEKRRFDKIEDGLAERLKRNESTVAHLCDGTALDSQILRELFYAVVGGGRTLADAGFWAATVAESDMFEKVLSKLPGMKVSENGTLMQWYEDYEAAEPDSSISHLFGLYPGGLIDHSDKPNFEICRAAEKSLSRFAARDSNERNPNEAAWIIGLWARLKKADEAYNSIGSYLSTYCGENLLSKNSQITGIFGGGAGITECLMQSHNGYLRFLPACPPEFKSGSIKGLRAMKDFTIDMEWTPGEITVKIHSGSGKPCFILSDEPIELISGTVPGGITEAFGGWCFQTEAGRDYTIRIGLI